MMQINMEKYSKYAPAMVRIGMSLVFLWFGWNQLTNTEMWLGVVPESIANFVGAKLVVLLNGWFEIVAGLCLLVGFQTRVVALLLALHLFGIAFSFGWHPIGIRDFGLAIATLSIFFAGADVCCWERRREEVTVKNN